MPNRTGKRPILTDPISGLTDKEIGLLLPCIRALEELERGKRRPRTHLQRQFVGVCQGKLPARTPYEYAYLKWRKSKPDLLKLTQDMTAKRNARERELNRINELRKIEARAKEREAVDIARQKEKYKTPTRRVSEWGTREDWKRDRGSWRR